MTLKIFLIIFFSAIAALVRWVEERNPTNKSFCTKIELSFNSEVLMGKEEELLEHWRELTQEKQQKVLEFVEQLKSESETTPSESDFVPQTPLAKKLWSIRQRAIAAGLRLLNEDEIELELAARRGGYRES
jgi:hypothetical protein